MKRLVEVSKEESGLMSLMGETVTLLCCRYFYTGKLIGVNDTCIELQNPKIIYDTGKWDNTDWADAQVLPTNTLFIMTGSVEAFGVIK